MPAPPLKNSHCSYCGAAYALNQPWPRTCARCDAISYVNPLPVAVLLLPIDDGVLVVRRAIPPRQGQLALPGGFIDQGESWQAAAARELREEAGVTVNPTELRLFDALSAPDGTVLIFGTAEPRRAAPASFRCSLPVPKSANAGCWDSAPGAIPCPSRLDSQSNRPAGMARAPAEN